MTDPESFTVVYRFCGTLWFFSTESISKGYKALGYYLIFLKDKIVF